MQYSRQIRAFLRRFLRATITGFLALCGSAYPALATTINDPAFKPLGTFSVPLIIGRVISWILGLVGIIALGMFVYGGIMWMVSAGNQEKVTKAKNTLVWSAIGLVVVLGAASFVTFVMGGLGVN